METLSRAAPRRTRVFVPVTMIYVAAGLAIAARVGMASGTVDPQRKHPSASASGLELISCPRATRFLIRPSGPLGGGSYTLIVVHHRAGQLLADHRRLTIH